MKIAICNETYQDWSFEDAFRHAKRAGYEGIEIAPFTIEQNAFQISEQRCAEIADLAAASRLQIIGLHWLLAFSEGLHLTSRDRQTRQRTSRYLLQLAKICRQLGGSLMVLGSPAQRNMPEGMTRAEADDLVTECIRAAVAGLAEYNVILALEPLGPEEGNYLLTAQWGRDLIQKIDSAHVKLHLDVKAMSTESATIPQIIRDSQHDLVHFHANDPNRRGPGMGNVHYEPILAALKAINYQGWLSVEVFDRSIDPAKMAQDSAEYLGKQLKLLKLDAPPMDQSRPE